MVSIFRKVSHNATDHLTNYNIMFTTLRVMVDMDTNLQ